MYKLIFTLIFSSLTFSCFAKTVKDSEIERSQNLVALFNKACMEAYLDDDKLSNFLLKNNFEDLNDETIKKNNSDNSKKSSPNNNEKNNSHGFGLASDGKHYSIENDKKVFFLDITDDSCSVLVKSINHDIFDLYFKEFRKSLTSDSFSETSKTFETRKGSNNYKVTAYFYFSEEEILPFELYLSQTNSTTADYQLKLSIHLGNRKEVLQKKKNSLNASSETNSTLINL